MCESGANIEILNIGQIKGLFAKCNHPNLFNNDQIQHLRIFDLEISIKMPLSPVTLTPALPLKL